MNCPKAGTHIYNRVYDPKVRHGNGAGRGYTTSLSNRMLSGCYIFIGESEAAEKVEHLREEGGEVVVYEGVCGGMRGDYGGTLGVDS